MMHDVHLYGDLAEKYGALHTFAIDSAPEAVSALCANYPGFDADFRRGSYHVRIGESLTAIELDEQSLRFKLGRDKPVHFIPVAEGSKGNGNAVKIVAGLALLTPWTFEFGTLLAGGVGSAAEMGAMDGFAGGVAGAAAGASQGAISLGALGSISYGSLASVGLSLLIGGVANILSPLPKRKQDSSFLFNGAVNTSNEGSAIPLVYGRFQVGSIVISAGEKIVQLL